MLQPMGAFSILSWESLNPAVAVVEDGLVTAVSTGETTITVTTQNGLSASCAVVVGVLPTQISLNASCLQLWEGMTFQLIPSVDQGEAAFSYESFNESVVTVDANGLISAANQGEAVVRVTTESGLWADCQIRCSPSPTAIYIDSSQPGMLVVGHTFQLEAQGEFDAPICYKSTDESIITVDESGLITVEAAGKAQVILSLFNGVTAVYDVTTAMPPETLTKEMDEQLHAELQADIDAILNSKTEIVHSDTYIPGKTYTGRAFYVSADGDDNNDGLTPETAWRTIGKVNKEAGWDENGAVQAGDIVFFRRGDTFRLTAENGGTMMPSRDGITFSAYGEGEKPIITYSSENGSGAEKWELAYEDESGIKIWKYYRDMSDVSMIVCNDGEVITSRVYEWWNGNDYVSCYNEEGNFLMDGDSKGVTLLDSLLNLKETLTEDMSIVSRPERGEGFECYDGPVYLRCDAGNPGDLYDSMEFTEYNLMGNVWLSASNTVFDNISFRNGGRAFFANGGTATSVQNTTVQNCEFAYGGGTVSKYDTSSGVNFLAVHGDGIYTIVNNANYKNNYFHDMPSCAISYEYSFESTESPRGFWHVVDNVLVNTFGLRLDSSPEALKDLSSVVIRGNQIWNTGSTDLGGLYYAEGGIFYMPNRYSEAIIEDNVFYTSEDNHPTNALLNLVFYDHDFFTGFTKPVLQNNTYVQHEGHKFADFMMQMGESWLIDELDVVVKAVEILGDTLSRFFIKK